MAGNTGLDWLIGSVPIVGDILDVGLRANRRNVDLLRSHLEQRGRLNRASDPADRFQSPDGPKPRKSVA